MAPWHLTSSKVYSTLEHGGWLRWAATGPVRAAEQPAVAAAPKARPVLRLALPPERQAADLPRVALSSLAKGDTPARWRVEARVASRQPMQRGAGYILELEDGDARMRAFVLGPAALAAFAGAAKLNIGCRCAISGTSKQVRQVEAQYKGRADAAYKINLDSEAAACEVAGLTECSKSTDFAADFAACRPAAEALRAELETKLNVKAMVHAVGELEFKQVPRRTLTLFAGGGAQDLVALTLFGEAAERAFFDCTKRVVLAKHCTVKCWNGAIQFNSNTELVVMARDAPGTDKMQQSYLDWRLATRMG